MSPIDDERLVHGLLQGDEEAVEAFVDRFYRPILSYLFRMLHDRSASEDVCQEVFVRAMRRIDQVRDPAGLAPWLYRIAANLARDHLRRRPGEALLEDVSPVVAQDGGEPEDGVRERLYVSDLLAALSPEQREVVVLRFYEDLSLARISEILSIPIGTVKSRLHHALRILRRQLEGESKEVASDALGRRKANPSHVG